MGESPSSVPAGSRTSGSRASSASGSSPAARPSVHPGREAVRDAQEHVLPVGVLERRGVVAGLVDEAAQHPEGPLAGDALELVPVPEALRGAAVERVLVRVLLGDLRLARLLLRPLLLHGARVADA